MGILWLVWLVSGVIAGALANGARLGLGARGIGGRWAWLETLALGALAALVGGWLGTALFGSPYGSPTALSMSVLAVALLPWLLARLARLAPRLAGKP